MTRKGTGARMAGGGDRRLAETRGTSSSSAQRRAVGTEAIRKDSPIHDRLLYALAQLVGLKVTVRVKHESYEGIFKGCATDSIPDRLSIVLAMARKVSTEQTEKYVKLMVIKPKDICHISAEDVDFDTQRHHDRHTFATDTETGVHRNTGRELQHWEPDPNTKPLDDLDWESGADWDQFGTNEQKFGVTTTYEEEIYTTKLDHSKIDPATRQEAAKLAREIEAEGRRSTGWLGRNVHVREERGLEVTGVDEEDLYGAVVRDKAVLRQGEGSKVAREQSSRGPQEMAPSTGTGNSGTGSGNGSGASGNGGRVKLNFAAAVKGKQEEPKQRPASVTASTANAAKASTDALKSTSEPETIPASTQDQTQTVSPTGRDEERAVASVESKLRVPPGGGRKSKSPYLRAARGETSQLDGLDLQTSSLKYDPTVQLAYEEHVKAETERKLNQTYKELKSVAPETDSSTSGGAETTTATATPTPPTPAPALDLAPIPAPAESTESPAAVTDESVPVTVDAAVELKPTDTPAKEDPAPAKEKLAGDAGDLKSKSLNPSAKPFSFNPSAKSFVPVPVPSATSTAASASASASAASASTSSSSSQSHGSHPHASVDSSHVSVPMPPMTGQILSGSQSYHQHQHQHQHQYMQQRPNFPPGTMHELADPYPSMQGTVMYDVSGITAGQDGVFIPSTGQLGRIPTNVGMGTHTAAAAVAAGSFPGRSMGGMPMGTLNNMGSLGGMAPGAATVAGRMAVPTSAHPSAATHPHASGQQVYTQQGVPGIAHVPLYSGPVSSMGPIPTATGPAPQYMLPQQPYVMSQIRHNVGLGGFAGQPGVVGGPAASVPSFAPRFPGVQDMNPSAPNAPGLSGTAGSGGGGSGSGNSGSGYNRRSGGRSEGRNFDRFSHGGQGPKTGLLAKNLPKNDSQRGGKPASQQSGGKVGPAPAPAPSAEVTRSQSPTKKSQAVDNLGSESGPVEDNP
eukprot:Rmarinus@m.22323